MLVSQTIPYKIMMATNRDVSVENGAYLISSNPSRYGPNELRLYSVNGSLASPTIRSVDGSEYVGHPIENMGVERRALFYIHGFNTNAEEAISSAFALADYYERDVFLFTWATPKYNLLELFAYTDIVRDNRVSVDSLSRMMRKLRDSAADGSSWDFMAFSFGAQLTSYAYLGAASGWSDFEMFGATLFVAPAVGAASSVGWLSDLAEHSQTTIVFNSRDYAMTAQRIATGRERLGQNPGAANCVNGIDYLDVRELPGVERAHSFHVAEKAGLAAKAVIRDVLNQVSVSEEGLIMDGCR